MSDQVYDLAQYVEDLRRITREETDDKKILERVAPLAQKFAASPGLIKDEYYNCDEEQGFSLNMLHEEKDHSNAVFLFTVVAHDDRVGDDVLQFAHVAGVMVGLKNALRGGIDLVYLALILL